LTILLQHIKIPPFMRHDTVTFTAALQAVICVVAGIAGYALQGGAAAAAALYGAMVALANTLFLLWRMRRSEQNPQWKAVQHLRLFYRSGLERFLLVAALLALGMGLLKLVPAAVLIGFVVSQLAWVLAPFMAAKK